MSRNVAVHFHCSITIMEDCKRQRQAVVQGAMTVLMIPEQEWDSLKKQIDDIRDFVTRKEKKEEKKPGNEWIDSGEVMKTLHISSRTWSSWRKAGYIPFSQFGNKIYVLKKDLQTFMESNHIKAKIGYIDYGGGEDSE